MRANSCEPTWMCYSLSNTVERVSSNQFCFDKEARVEMGQDRILESLQSCAGRCKLRESTPGSFLSWPSFDAGPRHALIRGSL